MQKKVSKTIKYIFLIIFGLFILLIIWNLICRKMVVEITGKDGVPTIVLLPGWGCASPVLEFRPLTERLAKDYRVIMVETFGYGLSDGTDKELTCEQ